MPTDSYRRAARAAFSDEEWAVILGHPSLAAQWLKLSTVADAESFITEAAMFLMKMGLETALRSAPRASTNSLQALA